MTSTTIHIADRVLTIDESSGTLFDPQGRPVAADVRKISEGEFSVLTGGRSIHLFLERTTAGVTATINNFTFDVRRETLRDILAKQLQRNSDASNGAVNVKAPMPGLITRILFREGATVKQGEGVVVIEAMKMENEIKAPRTGIVKTMVVKELQTAEKNDILFIIESL